MNFPTGDQIKSTTRSVTISLSSMLAGAAMLHLIGSDDPQKIVDAVNSIGNGVASIVTGVGALVTLGMGAWGVVTASPLRKLFSSTKTIAASAELTAQVNAAPLAEKLPLVIVTDKLPEVAGVGTTRDEAGKALAAAVPSNTVQPVSPISGKVIAQ
jgi:hypothetical protein